VEDPTKYGIAELDYNNLVISFLEKPKPSQTTSRIACPCFYIFRPSTLKLIRQYVAEAKSLQEVDAPGTFITWLFPRSPVYASPVRRRFDIGSLPTYIEADEYYYGRDGEKEKDEKVKIQRAKTPLGNLSQSSGSQTNATESRYVIVGLVLIVAILIKLARS